MVFPLVFDALKRDQATHALWIVWCALWLEATTNDPTRLPLLPYAMSDRLDFRPRTWRKLIRVLAKLGLIVPCHTVSRSSYDLILVRTELPDSTTDLLRAVAAGAVEISVGHARVRFAAGGPDLDLRPTEDEASFVIGQTGPVRQGIVPLRSAMPIVSNSR